MAFKHGVSEGAINGFPRSNKLLEDFFKNTLLNGCSHLE